MKKIISLLCILCIIVCFSSCENKTFTQNDLSIYDNQTKQYIKLGDTKEYIDSVLGKPSDENGLDCEYKNSAITTMYENEYGNKFASFIFIKYREFDDSDKERFEFCDININSSLEDINKKFTYVNSENSNNWIRYTLYFSQDGNNYKNVPNLSCDVDESSLDLKVSPNTNNSATSKEFVLSILP